MNESLPYKWPEEGNSRIPFWVYSDPRVYEREQERVFGGASYSFVALEADIPNPGDFKHTKIGDRPVVVVRDTDGNVNVLVNRCAHRGTRYCYREHGNAKEFICPYHQWTYDLTGALISVPFRRGVKKQGGMPDDFRLEDHHLEALKCALRGGVVFASFDHAMPAFEDYLGPKMLGYFDRVFDGRELSILGYSRQRMRANWKLMFENLKDPYHASLLHVFLVSFGLFRADNPSQVQMDEKTGMHSVQVSRRGEQKASEGTREMRQFDQGLRLHNPEMLQPVPEFPGDATVVMQTIWPNLIVQQQSNTLAMRQIQTLGPEVFELHWTFFGYADDDDGMTMRRLRQANLMGPAGFVSIDDSEVMEAAQFGLGKYPDAEAVVEMGGRGVEDQDHMVTESSIRAFYDHYRNVMGF